MPRYTTTWLDYRLPTGQEFAIAVCGFSARVRHMFLGDDPVRRMLVRHVDVNGKSCSSAEHCLALECPLNKTEREHLAHMLDMPEDEDTDAQTQEIWGTDSTVDAMVKFAQRMSEALPPELAKPSKPEPET